MAMACGLHASRRLMEWSANDMKSKMKAGLLSLALVAMLTPAVACDDYLYGFDSFFIGVDVYPGYYGGCCFGGYYYDDDDDFFDDLEDFWDDFEDDWDDLFDD